MSGSYVLEEDLGRIFVIVTYDTKAGSISRSIMRVTAARSSYQSTLCCNSEDNQAFTLCNLSQCKVKFPV